MVVPSKMPGNGDHTVRWGTRSHETGGFWLCVRYRLYRMLLLPLVLVLVAVLLQRTVVVGLVLAQLS